MDFKLKPDGTIEFLNMAVLKDFVSGFSEIVFEEQAAVLTENIMDTHVIAAHDVTGHFCTVCKTKQHYFVEFDFVRICNSCLVKMVSLLTTVQTAPVYE